MHSSHWTWQHQWYNVHFTIALIRWSLDNESTIIMKIKILLLTLPRRMIQIQSEHYHKHQELPVLFIWRLCAPSTEGRHLLQHLQFWIFHIWHKWSLAWGCVSCNIFWPWPISSRLFSCDMAYFMDYSYMWHKYNPWGDNVSHIPFQSIGHRTRSHRSFEFFAIWSGVP